MFFKKVPGGRNHPAVVKPKYAWQGQGSNLHEICSVLHHVPNNDVHVPSIIGLMNSGCYLFSSSVYCIHFAPFPPPCHLLRTSFCVLRPHHSFHLLQQHVFLFIQQHLCHLYALHCFCSPFAPCAISHPPLFWTSRFYLLFCFVDCKLLSLFAWIKITNMFGNSKLFWKNIFSLHPGNHFLKTIINASFNSKAGEIHDTQGYQEPQPACIAARV